MTTLPTPGRAGQAGGLWAATGHHRHGKPGVIVSIKTDSKDCGRLCLCDLQGRGYWLWRTTLGAVFPSTHGACIHLGSPHAWRPLWNSLVMAPSY